jgi:hypothetical protein
MPIVSVPIQRIIEEWVEARCEGTGFEFVHVVDATGPLPPLLVLVEEPPQRLANTTPSLVDFLQTQSARYRVPSAVRPPAYAPPPAFEDEVTEEDAWAPLDAAYAEFAEDDHTELKASQSKPWLRPVPMPAGSGRLKQLE